MKLWGGRFNKETNKLVEDFNASINFDKRLYQYDIKGSKIHAKMLARQGIIDKEEAEKIVNGLTEVKKEIEKGNIEFATSLEDIHTVIEKNLIEKIGDIGGKLHTARSRNDQIALDIRLYLRDMIKEINEKLLNFLNTLLELAAENKSVLMPGFTHLQKAQPVTLGHHLLAYYFKFKRDYNRFQDNFKRINISPLGSGALAGTSFPVDREWVASELDFDDISGNSMDSVSDRDFIIEFLSIASTLMMHFSRFSEEIIIWSSSEFDFIELDDSFTTGSSIMPQKKNPDVAELVRGKTGRVYGHLTQLLTTLKGLPLAYNKDMQEDKEGLFDTVDTVQIILEIFPDMLETMEVKADKLKESVQKGYMNATELANYLVKKDIPFRKAHGIVGKAILYAIKNDLKLKDISLDKWRELIPDLEIDEEIYDSLDEKKAIENSDIPGGPAPHQNQKIIDKEKNWLKDEIN